MHPIRQYRQKHSLSTTDVAEGIGCSQPTISRIETGARKPTFPLAEAIERFTNGEVTAEAILNYTLPKGYAIVRVDSEESTV